MKSFHFILLGCLCLYACKKREEIPVAPLATTGQLRLVEQIDSVLNSGEWIVTNTHYTYDELNRIKYKDTYQSGTTTRTYYDYVNGWWSGGHTTLSTPSDIQESVALTRNAKNEIVNFSLTLGNSTYPTDYEYDANGNLTKETQWNPFPNISPISISEYSDFVNNRWTKSVTTDYPTSYEDSSQRITFVTKRVLDVNGFELQKKTRVTIDNIDSLPNQEIRYTRQYDDSSLREIQYTGLSDGALAFLKAWQNINHQYYSPNDDVLSSEIPMPTLQDQTNFPDEIRTPQTSQEKITVIERNYYGLPTKVVTVYPTDLIPHPTFNQSQITHYRYEGD